tara:strand:+ start:189 stop:725 length:537 start_codon:yes stop_codon:yes gene_type:complete
MLTTIAVVVLYMEFIHSTSIVEKPKYIEVEIPAIRPDFHDEAVELSRHSTLNTSKLKHLLLYTWGLCEEYRVPYDIVKAVIHTESSWKHKAVSKSGAIGLMQVKPTTSLAEFNTPGDQLYDPYINITVGIKYLARLHERFVDWNTALTAYSHGPTATVGFADSYIASNFYVKRVLAHK